MTNKTNTVFYTGVTGDLIERAYGDKEKSTDGFTSKYNVSKLVYYEIFEEIYEAIKREKQIKGGSRKKKIDLILKFNSTWKNLYGEIASS